MRCEVCWLFGSMQTWPSGASMQASPVAITLRISSSLIDFAFSELGLEHVRFVARADNPRAVRALEKFGAVADGYVAGGTVLEGARHDVLLFSIWRDED